MNNNTLLPEIPGTTAPDEGRYTLTELFLYILPGIIVFLIGVAVALGCVIYKKRQQRSNGSDCADHSKIVSKQWNIHVFSRPPNQL